jgi:hypothetical protein
MLIASGNIGDGSYPAKSKKSHIRFTVDLIYRGFNLPCFLPSSKTHGRSCCNCDSGKDSRSKGAALDGSEVLCQVGVIQLWTAVVPQQTGSASFCLVHREFKLLQRCCPSRVSMNTAPILLIQLRYPPVNLIASLGHVLFMLLYCDRVVDHCEHSFRRA